MSVFHVRPALAAALLLVAVAEHASFPVEAAAQTPVNPQARTMAEFTDRVARYAELHRTVESSLPKLPHEATPIQIDKHQREFGARMAKARSGARQGDIFTPEMQQTARALMARLFRDADSRRALRDSVMDDNPGAGSIKLIVNGRYPDAVPLSTMPPDVLKQMPKLPEELEYRFVGDHLILLDPAAHIVVDYVPRVLPR